MEAMSMDLFFSKERNYLILLDSYSSFPMVSQLHSTASSSMINASQHCQTLGLRQPKTYWKRMTCPMILKEKYKFYAINETPFNCASL